MNAINKPIKKAAGAGAVSSTANKIIADTAAKKVANSGKAVSDKAQHHQKKAEKDQQCQQVAGQQAIQ